MKKGIIIIVLITLSLILFKPPKINASTVWSEDWAQLLPTLTRVDYNDCSTTSNYANGRPYCTKAMEMDYNEITTGIGTRPFVSTTTSMTIGTNGYVITVPTQKVKPGYLYNVNFYVCSNKNLSNANHDINMGQLATKNNYNTYAQTTSTNLPNVPGIEGNIKFNFCNKVSALIVPDMESVFLNYRITSNSTITSVYVSTIAVEISEMGIYTSELEKVIENSGFATSESVEQVQDSVNRVEEAITGEHDYNNTPSEELEGKEDLDNLKEKEEELLGNLDFSGADNLEITIEPESASFIWQVVDALRSMSGKIVLLITSILGLGIIKMILNR